MTFTIPRAGTDAGRAAEIRIRTPQTGAMIAELGQVAFNVTAALQQERDQRELQRAAIDFTRDLNELRLEAMQMGDPDQMEAFWTSRTAELRDSYLTGVGPDGKPRVSERNRPDFELSYDRLANGLAFDVGRDALAARMSQREANWLAYEHTLTTTAANAGPDARAVMVEQGAAEIDRFVADGIITAEEGQRRKMALAGAADNAAAIQALAVDPEGFLADMDEGEYAALDVETSARLRVQALTALDRIARDEANAAEQATTAAQKLADATLKEIGAVLATGTVPANIGYLNSEDAATRPLHAEVTAAYELLQEQPGLSTMSQEELLALRAEEAKRPVTFAYQTERLKVLDDMIETNAKGYAADKIGFARSRGFPVPDLPVFDPQDPKPYMQALLGRDAVSDVLMERGLTDAPAIFDADESAALAEAYGPKGDPEMRTQWLMALAGTFDDGAARVATQATGDRVTGYAAGLLAQGARPGVVRDIVAGQRRIADKTVVMPPRNDFITAYAEATGDEFRELFNLTPDLIDAAIAIYTETGGAADEIDTATFGTALQRALGATPDGNGALTVGGLQEFDTIGTWGGISGRSDNYVVPLPIGVARVDVETALKTVMSDLTPRRLRDDPDIWSDSDGTYHPPKVDALNAISLTGAPPDFSEVESPGDMASTFGRLRLETYWPDDGPTGIYLLYQPRADGGRDYLHDTNGAPFQFRLEDLIRETRR